MTDLPPATPVTLTPQVHSDDVRNTVRGLDPGWYRTEDLMTRYKAVARRAGRVPGVAQRLGMAIRKEFPDAPVRYVHGHVRVFELTDAMIRD